MFAILDDSVAERSGAYRDIFQCGFAVIPEVSLWCNSIKDMCEASLWPPPSSTGLNKNLRARQFFALPFLFIHSSFPAICLSSFSLPPIHCIPVLFSSTPLHTTVTMSATNGVPKSGTFLFTVSAPNPLQSAHLQLLIRSHSPSLLARVTPTRSPIRSLMPSSMPVSPRTPSPRLLARLPPRPA